ncbi:tape measure protein [Sphingobium phenoxybenzoativorans]|uniref:Tape measure protein n=1 Tax=Sphingobium phenoxybenzoativorans TaxID=1592790 RepID=A0A975K4T1_9SPHN|nr:tape measure protein [Sphingobium phenoxybenzoativorans]QUT04846.1 tape measure protein [Sphingobium phenoxybenzoativorans]
MADTDVKALMLQVDASVELLRKNLAQGEQIFNRFQQAGDRALDKLDGRFAKTYSSMGRLGTSAKMAQAQIEASTSRIRDSIRNLAGAFGLYLSGRELISLTDGFTRMQNSLKVAGLEGQRLESVQNALFASAQKYGTSIESLSALFGRLSQGGKELGATQDDLLKFSNGVAAALKVQGGTAESTAGAILQLTQALGGAVVRAEEFNSINEGARPILQAVASNIDRFGGSVAKLRAEVIEGKVTSQEFFQAFLKGTDGLEKQASAATLTVAAAMTQLNNALTVYFGEASKTSGASAALTAAIGALADNLETVIPAIATIVTGLGVGYVRSALAAATATRSLGSALLGAFGGPAGLAITAVVVGLSYVAAQSIKAKAEMDALIGTVDSAEAALAKAADRAKAAGVNVGTAGSAATTATGKFIGLGGAFQFAAEQAAALAKNTKLAELALIQSRIHAAETANAELRAKQSQADQSGSILKYAAPVANAVLRGSGIYDPDKKRSERAAKIAENDEIIKLAKQQAGIVNATPESAFEEKPNPASPKPPKTKKPSGPTAEQIEQRHIQEMARLNQEELAARADLVTDASERADLQFELLRAEYRERVAQVDADKHFTAEQKAAQKAALLRLYGSDDGSSVNPGILTGRINRDLDDTLAQEAQELAKAANANARDDLQASAGLADTRTQRQAIELSLLDLAFEQERIELDAVLASRSATETQKEIARRRLAILGSLQDQGRENINRQYEGPLDRYRREVSGVGKNISDEMESIQVRGLQNLNDGLTDAIMGAKNLGDVFKGVAKQIISDLIRVAIQQTIVNNLLGGMGGGGSGFLQKSASGAGDFVSNLISGKREFGGPVIAGQAYLVGEKRPEVFVPEVNGRILANAGAGRSAAQTVVHQTIQFTGAVDLATRAEVYRVADAARAAAIKGVRESGRRSG